MLTKLLFLLAFTLPVLCAVPYSSGWHNVPGVESDVAEFMDQHPEVDLIFFLSSGIGIS